MLVHSEPEMEFLGYLAAEREVWAHDAAFWGERESLRRRAESYRNQQFKSQSGGNNGRESRGDADIRGALVGGNVRSEGSTAPQENNQGNLQGADCGTPQARKIGRSRPPAHYGGDSADFQRGDGSGRRATRLRLNTPLLMAGLFLAFILLSFGMACAVIVGVVSRGY